jgi:hypothetical protein
LLAFPGVFHTSRCKAIAADNDRPSHLVFKALCPNSPVAPRGAQDPAFIVIAGPPPGNWRRMAWTDFDQFETLRPGFLPRSRVGGQIAWLRAYLPQQTLPYIQALTMKWFRFQQRSLRWRQGWFLIVALCMCAAGCTTWTTRWNALRDRVRGHGYTDESANWTQNIRSPSDSTPMAGVDERARQIERNLGVR